jgi:hypothetical protein
MKFFVRSSILVAALGWSSMAHAAHLYTRPLWVATGDYVLCKIVNITDKFRDVRIQVIKVGGTVVSDTLNFPLQPFGMGQADNASVTAAGGSNYICHFIVGKRSFVRASANLSPAGTGKDTIVVPAE